MYWVNIQLPAQRISDPGPAPHQVQPAPIPHLQALLCGLTHRAQDSTTRYNRSSAKRNIFALI